MAEPQRIFGIPEIDQPLWTALPPGWLAVLSGTSGSGAPLLAKQFAHAGVGEVPVLFYTTYERTEDVRKAFDDFGWDPGEIKIVNLADEYFDRVLVRGLEIAKAREGGITVDDLVDSHPTDRALTPFSLTNRMLSDLARIDSPFRMVVDSVDFFLEVMEPHELTTVARQIRHRCQTIGGHALITVHSITHDRSVFGLLQDLADLVFELRAEPRHDHFEHTISIDKVANRPDLTRIWDTVLGEAGWNVQERSGAAR
ncbi:MAG TPA: ATPase domain-containing protein [Thermoplasmata archaeon]|nr:ATPase domain-containing protein [Thermoplasmata archaeon]HYB77545.1 ATPase domain-containing protein [Thermoplasmata archaeon]